MNERKCNLIEYLPDKLQDIKEFKVIFNILNKELDLLNFNKQDVFTQCFIDTATWGLTLWERRFAIKTDLSKSYEERRELIKAKRRGYGTVTKSKMKYVAEAFTDGQVNVTEESELYKFLIEFINGKNKLNLNGLYDIVDEIKPAHLDYTVALNDDKTLSIETKVKNYDIDYNLCGTIDCGVEPDIVTEGIAYIDTVDIGTNNSNINQIYPVSGTINTGGERL